MVQSPPGLIDFVCVDFLWHLPEGQGQVIDAGDNKMMRQRRSGSKAVAVYGFDVFNQRGLEGNARRRG